MQDGLNGALFGAKSPIARQQFARRIAQVALSSIDQAIENRWATAQERARRVRGETIEDRVSNVTSMFARELAIVGAGAGGAAAVPGVGVPAALAAGFTEFGFFTFRASELVLTIGAIHGHDDVTVEEQRAWILSVLAFGGSASEGFTRLAGELGRGLGKRAATRVPISLLRAINKAAGRQIVTKFGTKRAVIVLGRALPFGVGAAIGGGANFVTTQLLAKHAHKFFETLPYTTVFDDAANSAN